MFDLNSPGILLQLQIRRLALVASSSRVDLLDRGDRPSQQKRFLFFLVFLVFRYSSPFSPSSLSCPSPLSVSASSLAAETPRPSLPSASQRKQTEEERAGLAAPQVLISNSSCVHHLSSDQHEHFSSRLLYSRRCSVAARKASVSTPSP